MVVQSNVILEILGRDAYWIAFFTFLFIRPVLHILPIIRVGNPLLDLAIGATITMALITAMLMLPLFVFDYIPMPRSTEFRQAYFYGVISGGLLTHALWLLLIKLSILKEHVNS